MIDLGGGGFRVESRRQLQQRLDYRVRFAEPGSSLRFSAEPVWNRLIRTEGSSGNVHPVYASGFRFSEELQTVQRRSLGEFVKERAERAIADRKPPRYAMKRGTAAELVAAVPFRVRELSLSGMLVEAEGLEEIAGDSFAVTLELPTAALDLSARLVATRRASPGGSAQAGVAFDAISDRQSRELDGFLAGQLSD